MVAVISGSGLGLFGSTVSGLGGIGGSGNTVGRGNDRIYVNTSTGNLIVQSQDEHLSSLGLDLNLVRTYNSQGLLNDDNGDNWRLGIHQRVYALTGTRNTAGSTITKVFGDGREVRYTYDEERSAYVSTEGDGAHDTLQYDEPAGAWIWTDGSERNTESYDSDGRLMASRDRVGMAVTYGYTGSLLTRITDASGQVTHLDYNGTDLTAIRVVSNNQTQTLTRYFYDSLHRLRQVVVDLTPTDNSAPLPDANGDGLYESVANQTYVTAYTYDGTSRRIASITQTDGSSVSFTYEQVGTTYRVKTHTDAEGRITTYSSVPVTGTWSDAIVQPSPAITVSAPKLAYDAAGNGIAVWASGTGVYMQRYSSASNSWGAISLVSGPSSPYAQSVGVPSLSVDSSGDALVAWVDPGEGTRVTRFSVASGTWSEPELLAANYLYDWDEVTAVLRGGTAALLWKDQNGSDLRLTRWTGSAWVAEVLASGTSSWSDINSKLSIDAAGNITLVTSVTEGSFVNRFTASTNSWSGLTVLENGGRSLQEIAFDADGNGFALWREGAVVSLRRYIAATNTWGDEIVVSTQASPYSAPLLSVDASGSALVVWGEYDESTGNGGLKARHYNAATGTWGPEAVLNDWASSRLLVAMRGGSAVVGWISDSDGLEVTRFDGTSWSAAHLIDEDSHIFHDASLATDANGNVAAIWRRRDSIGADTVFVNRFVGALGAWTGAVAHITPATESIDPQIVFDANGNAFAGWIGREPGSWGDGSVYIRRYDRATNTWSTLEELTRRIDRGRTANNVTAFKLAVDSQGNALAVWEQEQDGTGRTALYSSQYIDGEWIEPTVRATSSSSYGAGRIVAAINGSLASIAWLRSGSDDLYVVRLTASGWGEAESVETFNSNFIYEPTLGMDAAGNVTVAFKNAPDTALYVNRFDAATNAWSGVSALESWANSPKLAFSPDGNGVAIWSYGETLYARRFLSATNTWTAAVALNPGAWDYIEGTSLAVDTQGNAVVSWMTFQNDERRTQVARFDAASGSWSAPATLGSSAGLPWESVGNSVIAVNGSHAAVAWTHTAEAGNQFYIARYKDGVWSAPELLETAMGAVGQPSITIDSLGSIGVLWRQLEGQVESIHSKQYVLDALQVTNVTDALGRTTTYGIDRSGRLSSVLGPAVDGVRLETRYTYDAAGNLISITEDPAGLNRVTTFAYDDNGNLIRTVDALGNTVTRTYDARNQLRTETTYVVPDPDGAGSLQPAIPLTTRYTYDASSRLRFVISAEGRVTEHRYEPAGQGQRTSTLIYKGALHTGGTSLNSLVAWASAQDLTQLERTDFAYDFRGNLASVTTYDTTSAGGAGSGTPFVTRFFYDQRGKLLQTIDARGSDTPNPVTPNLPYATTYTYDGLGRVLSTTQWQSDTRLIRTSLYSYDDANRVTTTTLANGLVTTNTYNRAGELIRTENGTAAAQASLGRTRYAYDAAGRLRIATDPLGVRQFYLYDEAGRKVGEIDGDGTLKEFVYDPLNQVVKTVVYAQRIDSTTLRTLVNDNGQPLEVSFSSLRAAADDNPSQDRIQRTIYDQIGRPAYTVDEIGAVTRFFYDGAGRLLEQVRYANTVTIARSADEVRAEELTITPSADDRLTRYFYDADGKLLATLDPMGYLVENLYDPAGRIVKRVAYATATHPSYRLVGTLDQLRPERDDEQVLTPAQDIVTYFFYDAQGRKLGDLDAEGYLTETVYDRAGNASQIIRYDRVLANADGASTFATLKSQAVGAATHVQSYQYDGANRVTQRTDHQGTITRYTYDAVGNTVAVTAAYDTTEARSTEARYDLLGRVIEELTAEGRARITAGMTQEDIEEIWRDYGVTYEYDVAGRKIRATVRPIDGEENVTFYYYDDDNRLRFEVNALGEVKEHRYDAFGRLTDSIAYTTRISTATLTGGVLSSTLTNRVAGAAAAGNYAHTTYAYTLTGRVETTRTRVDSNAANDQLTTSFYNAFGEERERTLRMNDSKLQSFSYRYDRRGSLVETREGPSLILTESRAYDAFGRLTDLTDGRLNVVERFEYDRLGREIASTGANIDDRTIKTYDAFSRTLRVRNAFGDETVYQYDDASRQMTMTTPEGVQITTTFNRHGQTFTVLDGLGRLVTYLYNNDGQLTSVSDGMGAIEGRTYDRAGRQHTQTDARGIVTTITYDAANRVLTRTQDSAEGGLARVTTYTYDGQGRLRRVEEPGGRITQNSYDRAGQITEVAVDPEGMNLRTGYSFDRTGNVLVVTEGVGTPAQRRTQYIYDELGRRIEEIVDPIALGGTLNLRTQYKYDNSGNLTRKIDAIGHSTWYVYDADNRLTHTIDATGSVTQRTYDAEGRLIATRLHAASVSTVGFGDVVTAVSAIRNDSADRVTQAVYDRDGRERFTIDAVGTVTERTFDDNGNIVRTRGYANSVAPGSYTTIAAVNVALAAAQNDTQTPSSTDRVSWTVFDTRGNARFTIDATGAVVQSLRDAAGNVTSTVAYATLRTTSAPAGLADLESWAVQPSIANHIDNRTTRYWHDAAGREVFKLDGAGYLTETRYNDALRTNSTILYGERPVIAATATTAQVRQNSVVTSFSTARDRVSTTQTDAAGRVMRIYDALTASAASSYEEYGYDAVGNRISVTDPRGIELAERNSNWAQGERTRLGFNANAAALTSFERQLLRSRYTTIHAYDAAGRELSVTDALGGVTRNAYDAAGNLVKITDPNNHVAFRYYDAAGRLRYQIDPRGYVTQLRYDALGNVVDEFSYADALTGTYDETTSLQQLTNMIATDSTRDRQLTKTYDRSGRVRIVTHHATPVSYQEEYQYNAFGQKRLYQDRNGAVFEYRYNGRGDLTREILPQMEVVTGVLPNVTTQSLRLENYFEYTAFGEMSLRREATGTTQQRETRYFYDRRGLQSRVELPQFGVYDRDSNTTNVETPVVQKFYDAAGNLTLEIAAKGGRTVNYYDSRNLRVASVDADNVLREFAFDAVGNLISERTYGARVSGVPGPETRPPAPAGDDYRELQYEYNANNLRVRMQTRSETLFSYALLQLNGVGYYDAVVATLADYDANGNVVQTVDGNGNSTFSYFDAAGSRILQVDAAGYVIRWEYNAQGQLRLETKYAGQLPSSVRDALTARTSVQNILDAIPPGDDRITEYEYDRLGRVRIERKLGVEYSTVNAANGQLSTTTSDVETSFEYDGNGNLKAEIRPNGHGRIDYDYDALDRKTRQRDPQFLAYEGSVREETLWQYDAYGNLAVQTKLAQNAADNREHRYQYDTSGNLRVERDAAGAEIHRDYSLAGEAIRVSRQVTDVYGRINIYRTHHWYDVQGREIHRQDFEERDIGGTTPTYVTRETYDTRYNAHGDIEAKGSNGQYQEKYIYDRLGRLFWTNKENGTPRLHLYDANGNAVLEMHDIDSDLTMVDGGSGLRPMVGPSDVWLISPLDVQLTFNLYDRRNLLTQVFQPPMVFGDLLSNPPTVATSGTQGPPAEALGDLALYLPTGLRPSPTQPGTLLPTETTPISNSGPTATTGFGPRADQHSTENLTIPLSELGTAGTVNDPPVRETISDTVSPDGMVRTVREKVTKRSVETILTVEAGNTVLKTINTTVEVTTRETIFTRSTSVEEGEQSVEQRWVLNRDETFSTTRDVKSEAQRFARTRTYDATMTYDYMAGSYPGTLAFTPGTSINIDYQYALETDAWFLFNVPAFDAWGAGPTTVVIFRSDFPSLRQEQLINGAGNVNMYWPGGGGAGYTVQIYKGGHLITSGFAQGASGQAQVPAIASLKAQAPGAASGYLRLLNSDETPASGFWASNYTFANSNGTEIIFEAPYAGAFTAGAKYEYVVYDSSGQPLNRVVGTFGTADHRNQHTYTVHERTVQTKTYVTNGTTNYSGSHPNHAAPLQNNYLRQLLRTVTEGAVNENVISNKQTYNAFGEVISQEDALLNTTHFTYNDLGQMTMQRQPTTTIELAAGGTATVNPTTRYYYNEMGELVGTQDANSELLAADQKYFLSRRVWVNGRLEKEFDAYGNAKTYVYDRLGDKRQEIDALNQLTSYSYDKRGALTQVDRYNADNVQYTFDSYEYDAAGNRIAHTNGLHHRERYLFDGQNRVVRHISFEGRETDYSYTYLSTIGGIGGFETTTTTAGLTGLDTLVDREDYFGRIRYHRDLGGHEYTYEYNNAGWLRRQTGTTAATGVNQRNNQEIIYEYYQNGFLKSVSDLGISSFATFQYDRRGNRTVEAYSQTPITSGSQALHPYQLATAKYDALNRLISVEEAGKFSITYTYDAVGNRRSVTSRYWDLLNDRNQLQQFYYAYDRMSRFTITMGTRDQNTGQIVRGNIGYDIQYDALGRRQFVQSDFINKQTGQAEYVGEWYNYDPIDTVREALFYDAANNLTGRALRENNAIGELINYREYNAQGQTKHIYYEYDRDSLTVREEDRTNNDRRERTTYTLVGNGILTGTFGNTVNASGQQVSDSQTVSLQYSYEKWDSYKESSVTVTATAPRVRGWAPGTSTYRYNSNGHIVHLHDAQAARTIDYVNNHHGQVLRRYEIDHELGTDRPSIVRNFYYLSGIGVGDVGNDSDPSRVDYAQSFAEQMRDGRKVHQAIGDRITPVTSADFDQNYQPINANYPGRAAGSHIVQEGETLQSIARAVWGDGSLWYLLADANGLDGNERLVAGVRLTVPNVVANIHNNSETFRPYDASLALGDTTPTLPAPPPPANGKKGCGGFGVVLVLVVAIVVTVFTAGALAPASVSAAGGAAAGAAGAGGLVSAGAAVLGGAGGLAGFGAAVAGGAVGAAVSQGVAIAAGLQEDFDWKGVALGAVGAGVGAGLGSLAQGSSALQQAVSSFANKNPYAFAAMNGAASSALTQGVAVATDLQSSFSWRNVAISSLAAPAARAFGEGASRMLPSSAGFGRRIASSIGGSLVRRAFGSREDSASIVLDAFGDALGHSIVDGMAPRSTSAQASGGAADDLQEVQITPRYIGPGAEAANARLDHNSSSAIADPAFGMTRDEMRATDAARVAPGGGVEEVIVEAQKLTRPQELLYDRLISRWHDPKNEYEAMAIVDRARRYDIRYETSASIENDRALINMGLMTIGGAAAGVFGATLYPTVLAYSSSPLLAGAVSGVGADVAFQGYQNGLFVATDGSYGRSGIDGTELALSAGFGALPFLPAAIRGWADDLRGLGVPDWNIRFAPQGTLYTGGIGLELERIGGLELFRNQVPNALAAELRAAAAVGVRPIRVDDPGFEKIANEGTIKFVVTEGNELLIAPHSVRQTEISHAVLSQGRPVLAAGQAEIAATSGQYVGMAITPHSGHYLNGASVAQSALSESRAREAFARFGIMFPD